MMMLKRKDSIVNTVANNLGLSYSTAYRRLKTKGLVVGREERLELAKQKREIVGSLRAKGMSYNEIARELDVSVNIVKSLARQHKEKTEALQQELVLL